MGVGTQLPQMRACMNSVVCLFVCLFVVVQNTLERLWIRYLFEDPEEREERRWEHLAKMQKRKED